MASLASSIARTPRPHDRDRAAEARDLFSDAPSQLRDLLAGISGCSPYLKGLAEREADWLREVWDDAPQDTLHRILSATGDDTVDLGVALRRAKRRVALLIGLCDCGGVWSLDQVTGALTRLADLSVSRGLERELEVETRRGRLPDHSASAAGGMVALAMGKMGAFELNYSSDIDLICLFDEAAYDPDDVMTARASLVKATRRLCALLGDTTAEGYVFRTDLRLRPDPSVTPVCLGMDAAERYYESLGRTWERAAHIKARPCAGDVAAGERYLDRLRPFIWRRHLDFAAIDDAHAMRQRIRDHKGLGGRLTLKGHDMKLGTGGIREIEFFTQTRQIIAGGRDESLRVRGTLEGLGRLAAAGWVPKETARQLVRDYRDHREVEHRLQMIADRQTHTLPEDPDGFARLAAFLDRDPAALKTELTARLERVADLTEAFFAPARPHAKGPELTAAQAELVQGWRSLPALRSERALDIFDRIRPALLTRLLASPRPERALAHFDGFLRGLPAGVQLFSLFEASPELLDLIADIAGTTPELATYLSRNAAVLDAVLGGQFFADWPGMAALNTGLSRRLEAAPDYEAKLDAARSWTRDWHFRIGVHHLRGLIDGAVAGGQYAELAEAVVAALWPVVVTEFSARHGPPPGAGAMVLAMGSLGAGRLTARSDLDLIVIYDDAGQETSTGPRPLPARSYFARLTQGLVTALSAPTAQGRLYEVDMRLRPSGKQGPVATALASFDRYQRQDAWTWEHLALTRARAIAGPHALCAAVEAVRGAVLAADRDPDRLRADVSAMRDRLAGQRSGGTWDLKAGPGRLTEVELAASALGLLSRSDARAARDQIAAAARAGLVAQSTATELADLHGRFHRLQVAVRLLAPQGVSPDDLGASGEAMLLRESGVGTMSDLAAAITAWAERGARAVEEVLHAQD